MNARRVAPLVAVILVLLGATCILLREHFGSRRPLLPGDSFWELTYALTFHADKKGAKLHAAYPVDTEHGRVHGQHGGEAEASLERVVLPKAERHEMIVEAKAAGAVHAVVQFEIHLSPRAVWPVSGAADHLTPQSRARYLRSEKGVQVEHRDVLEALHQLQQEPAGRAALVDGIFQYCRDNIDPAAPDAPSDAAGTLKQHSGSTLGRARAMVALCRAAKIPARLAVGFEIKRGADVRPTFWVEAYRDGAWDSYDPENDYSHGLPADYLPVRHDEAEIITSGSEASNLRATFSIRPTPPPAAFRSEGPRLVDVLDLTRLPLDLHRVFEVLLLMPLGALVTSIFRTVIGIRTFGTFTPSLIALSFVYADWRTGLLVFAAVMVLGLASRKFLDQLKLLLVPRLSIILTLVVLCMAFGVSLLDYFALTPSAQAVLLPMVILTMTVERFYLTSEEDSVWFATQLLAGTMFLAMCCYLVLRWTTVGHKLLEYPEAHCFTIAVLIVMGRYTGYRLTELWRFRDVGSES